MDNLPQIIQELEHEVATIKHASSDELEILLHKLIHTAAQAVYVLNRDRE